MIYLKQSTASQTRTLGPFLDDTDGTTAETGLTIENTDVKLMANGGVSANKNSGGGTHRVNGHYSFTFDATDTATVGELTISIDVAGALPVWKEAVVMEEAVYDALFGAGATGKLPATLAAGDVTGNIPADVIEWDGNEVVNDNVTINSAQRIVPVVSVVSLADFPNSESAATGIRAAVGMSSANLDTQLSTIDTNVDTVLTDTNELHTDLADGGRVDLILDGIAEDTGTTIPALFPSNFDALGINASGHLSRVTLVDTTTTNTDMLTTTAVNAEVDTALADYDSPTKTEMDAAFTEIKGATFSDSTDSLEAIRDRGDTAWTTGAGGSSPTVEQIRAEIDSNSTQLAAIVADTNELQTDWANGGRLDLILDARASQASVDTIDGIVDDILVDTGTTIPGTLATIDSNVDAILTDTGTTLPGLLPTNFASLGINASGHVSRVTLTDTTTTNTDMRGTDGANTTTPLDASGVRTAVGLASGNLDIQIGDLPTLSEIFAGGDIDGYTLEETLKLCLAALAGKLGGATSTTVIIRAADDSKARITATVDENGNRTALTLDGDD